MKENKYGAHMFHLYFPLPKLRFYSPQIKEKWIRQIDTDKLHSLIQKKYSESGKVCTKVMIPRHPVQKSLADIRVVWNCTGDDVNPSIYNP